MDDRFFFSFAKVWSPVEPMKLGAPDSCFSPSLASLPAARLGKAGREAGETCKQGAKEPDPKAKPHSLLPKQEKARARPTVRQDCGAHLPSARLGRTGRHHRRLCAEGGCGSKAAGARRAGCSLGKEGGIPFSPQRGGVGVAKRWGPPCRRPARPGAFLFSSSLEKQRRVARSVRKLARARPSGDPRSWSKRRRRLLGAG